MVFFSSQMQMLQQAKQNQMQRDPSGMNVNQDRPSSPASGENAPSPSKRQRVDGGTPFNPNQPGMMPNGRPGQGMPGQQMAPNPAAATAAAHQMLQANGINPNTLNAQQLQNFVNAPPNAQAKSIASYSQNLQQHHGTQMGGRPVPNGPQGQGSPMMGQGPDGNALNAYYNPGEMGGPGGLRPGGPGNPQAAGSSNHALQDYQMQLMLLEQQNKKRLMMARQEQDNMGGIREPGPGGPGGPGGPPGPNGQPFPDTSPQAMRAGASPNPADQMKRGTPQMNNTGIPSPVPEGAQSRGSPNPGMNFMGNPVNPDMAPHFFNKMDNGMAGQQQMNGMRPPSSHPGQPFPGPQQMTPQMMAAARQQAAQQQQQQQQGGTPQQWQQGPNGQMIPQPMQQSPQIQGTPQQRAMPPPSAPVAAAANANNRTTASPQQAAAAPPTPNQGNKPAPKKKESKAAKDKVCISLFFDMVLELTVSSVLPIRRSQTRTSTPPTMQPLRAAENKKLLHLRPRLLRLTSLETSTRARNPMPQMASPRLELLHRITVVPLLSLLLSLLSLTETPARMDLARTTLATWHVPPLHN